MKGLCLIGATEQEFRVGVPSASGDVSAILLRPADARGLLVLGHGAGAGIRHPFMETTARLLAEHGLATLRYHFPYMERGARMPDPQPTLLATVRSAVAAAGDVAGDLPLLAGGKSMGGRMTSLAAASTKLDGVRGLVFIGFPLHPAGKPSTDRAGHLSDLRTPMLFLQGTRDRLADLKLLEPICEGLGARATLHVVAEADHSFRVLKRTGRTWEQVLEELAGVTAEWSLRLPPPGDEMTPR